MRVTAFTGADFDQMVRDIERLPKRIRRYINELEARVRAFEKAQKATEPTRIIVDPYEPGGAKTYLNDRLEVGFEIPSPHYRRNVVRISLRKDAPDSVYVKGDHGVSVIPNASNAFYIVSTR